MELETIRQKRNDLESAIEKLITQFINETNVEVSTIQFQPAVYGPSPNYQEVTPVEVNVELVI